MRSLSLPLFLRYQHSWWCEKGGRGRNRSCTFCAMQDLSSTHPLIWLGRWNACLVNRRVFGCPIQTLTHLLRPVGQGKFFSIRLADGDERLDVATYGDEGTAVSVRNQFARNETKSKMSRKRRSTQCSIPRKPLESDESRRVAQATRMLLSLSTRLAKLITSPAAFFLAREIRALKRWRTKFVLWRKPAQR